MRKLVSLSYISLFFSCIYHVNFAQGNNNGNTEPVQVCSPNFNLCSNQITGVPIISQNSDLPNLEYVIIDQSIQATNNSGPAIVAVDTDGIFLPSGYGIVPGSTIEIIPIAYNLNDIQNTIDDILKGVVFGLFPCCNFSGTICADLNNSGIFCGSDVTSMQDIFPLFNANGNLLSILDFVAALSEANMQLQDPNTPTACGGGDLITYAYGNACTYTVNENIATISVPDHTTSESIYRSDYIESGAVITSALNVEYFAGNYVELISPFEVQLGAAFLADILTCQ